MMKNNTIVAILVGACSVLLLLRALAAISTDAPVGGPRKPLVKSSYWGYDYNRLTHQSKCKDGYPSDFPTFVRRLPEKPKYSTGREYWDLGYGYRFGRGAWIGIPKEESRKIGSAFICRWFYLDQNQVKTYVLPELGLSNRDAPPPTWNHRMLDMAYILVLLAVAAIGIYLSRTSRTNRVT